MLNELDQMESICNLKEGDSKLQSLEVLSLLNIPISCQTVITGICISNNIHFQIELQVQL